MNKPFCNKREHQRVTVTGWLVRLVLMIAAGLGLLRLPAMLRGAPEAQGQVASLTLRVGFTRSSFRNVNANDATAAFRIFAQTAARKRGYELDVKARLFENMAECESEIKRGTINMATLDTWDYLNMDIQKAMTPVFVELEQGTIYRQYLLLTKRGAGLTNLADLRGRDLLILEGKGGDLSRAWLDSLLLAKHLGAKEAFFGKLDPVSRPAAAVLPVFFGTKPACLVDHTTLELMAELNPQVGSNLVIVARSDSYVENLTCLSKSGWPSEKARQDLIQGIAELHLEPSGQQVLELFKLDRLSPFKDEYLDNVRKLQQTLAAYHDIQARR